MPPDLYIRYTCSEPSELQSSMRSYLPVYTLATVLQHSIPTCFRICTPAARLRGSGVPYFHVSVLIACL